MVASQDVTRRSEKTTKTRRRARPVESAQELRVIAGHWRGRKWRFRAESGVRPTPDRVRETLFNWLAPRIVGARCLDLFAGSGALGIEALSRGAAQVCCVDTQATLLQALRKQLADWRASGHELIQADALRWLGEAPPRAFDLVFLDPPFASGLNEPALRLLTSRPWLAAGAWIYLEQNAADPLPALPAGWAPRKSGRAGAVGYYLLHAT
jgi:16S rRNA (guanine966-N2)-methyltransferase